MRLTLLALIFLDVVALGTVAVLFLRSAEAEHRVTLAEQEERACIQECREVADACEHALDTCIKMLSGGPR